MDERIALRAFVAPDEGVCDELDAFLRWHGITKLEEVDYYVCAYASGVLVGAGGLSGSRLAFLAADEGRRNPAVAADLADGLAAELRRRGKERLLARVDPRQASRLLSLGFGRVASCDEAALLEWPSGKAAIFAEALAVDCPPGPDTGVIVVDADPFTLGLRELVVRASAASERLIVLVADGEGSALPLSLRYRMVKEGLSELGNCVVLPACQYLCACREGFAEAGSPGRDALALLELECLSRLVLAPTGAKRLYLVDDERTSLGPDFGRLAREVLPSRGVAVTSLRRGAAADVGLQARAKNLAAEGRFGDLAGLVPVSTFALLALPRAQ
jgi:[citrate (pro-3S)-lyase] ligase